MPELPEVETTVRGLRKTISGLTIKNVWTDLSTKDKRQKESVANPKFFPMFRKNILNKKVLSVERRAKNILINISGGKTILVHLKMTGHLLFNNRDNYVHVIFYFQSGKYLAFSDIRKFGKITLLDTKIAYDTKHLNNIGPEPLEKNFNLEKLKERLNKKPNGKIKTILIDQSIIAGIGNIYSDEILWRAGVHPERKVSTLKEKELKLIFKAIKETLAKGIDFGGDSMSDYRNILGQKGKFQEKHNAYQRNGEPCAKPGCKGKIIKLKIGGRSAHFCDIHQRLFN